MKYVGYLVLILLFIYFVFVKPFLLLHRIEFEVKEPRINFKERSLEIGEFWILLPNFRGETFFFRVDGLALYKDTLKLKEFSLISVSSKRAEKPFEYDFSDLARRLNKINIHLKSAYISMNSLPYSESITLFIGRAHKEGNKIWAEEPTVAYYIHGQKITRIEVFVERAQLKGPTLEVLSSKVAGENYSFELKGRWKGKEGTFEAVGYVDRITTENFSIEPIKVEAKGWLDYKSIQVYMQLQTDDLVIKEKHFGRVTGRGEYRYRWRKESLFSTSLEGESLSGRLEYDLNRKALQLYLSELAFDEKLLGVKQGLMGSFAGRMFADLNKKTLSLDGKVKDLLFQDIRINTADLSLGLDYKKEPKGEVSFASDVLELKGRFYGKDFWGQLKVKGLPYQRENVRARVFYEGYLSYVAGNPESSGKGYLSDLYIYDRFIGRTDFNLNLKGQDVLVGGEGRSFKLSASGNIKDERIKGVLTFTGFSFREKGIELSNLVGQVSFGVFDKEVQAEGMLEGKLSQEKVQALANLEFNIKLLEGKPEGEFKSALKNVKLGDLEFKNGLLVGSIKDQKLYLTYSLEEKLKGSGVFSLSDYTFSTEGRWEGEVKGSFLALSYRLQSCSKTACKGKLGGSAKFKDITIPINARFDYEGERLRAEIKEFDLQKGPIKVRVGDLRLEEGKIFFSGGSVSLNSEELLKLSQAEGFYDLKKEGFEIPNIKIYRYAEGNAKISYSKTEGFNLNSEGHINLEKTSALFRSRVQTSLVGNLYYYLNIDEKGVNLVLLSKEPIELRSRYIGLPMRGEAYFYGDGKVFKGSMNFLGNGSSLTAEAEGTEKKLQVKFNANRLPVLYRDENLMGSLFLRGKGAIITDYKKVKISSDLSIAGIVEVRSFPKEKRTKRGETPITLDLKVSSYEPLRVYLPEGYIYSSLEGYAKGNLDDLEYKFRFSLSGGELKYFNKKFYVKSGFFDFDKKSKNIDLTIASPLPDYVILINLKGDPEYPKVLLNSEPPKETRKIITDLVLGGGEAQGIISLGDVLSSQIPQIGGLTKGLEKTLGTELNISVSPQLSSSGEVGVSTKVSKDITDRFSLEYQHSTLKDPKEIYVGGSARITSGISVGGRINSDGSREVRLRVRGKFNF
ncbi:MAG: translocation/assembly module TamB domain-containing protein [Thermocrinis sp.]|jgi:translocation and assembly module TamB|uniref:translocation/assembly module TamB domain-containing protein n=1 Tax=Thermocrinis sp. TaxID=2024383 RepID=UPI003C02D464